MTASVPSAHWPAFSAAFWPSCLLLTPALCAAFASFDALALHHALNEVQLLRRTAMHFSLMCKNASWSTAAAAACSVKLKVCSKQGLRGRGGWRFDFIVYNPTSLEIPFFVFFLYPVLQERLGYKIKLL